MALMLHLLHPLAMIVFFFYRPPGERASLVLDLDTVTGRGTATLHQEHSHTASSPYEVSRERGRSQTSQIRKRANGSYPLEKMVVRLVTEAAICRVATNGLI